LPLCCPAGAWLGPTPTCSTWRASPTVLCCRSGSVQVARCRLPEVAEGCTRLTDIWQLCVALQVPGSDPPHFKMHLKPGTPAKLGNQDSKAISRAGEGPGLQVAPGSVSEVRVAHCSSACCGNLSDVSCTDIFQHVDTDSCSANTVCCYSTIIKHLCLYCVTACAGPTSFVRFAGYQLR
jgi:hypothetical protein